MLRPRGCVSLILGGADPLGCIGPAGSHNPFVPSGAGCRASTRPPFPSLGQCRTPAKHPSETCGTVVNHTNQTCYSWCKIILRPRVCGTGRHRAGRRSSRARLKKCLLIVAVARSERRRTAARNSFRRSRRLRQNSAARQPFVPVLLIVRKIQRHLLLGPRLAWDPVACWIA